MTQEDKQFLLKDLCARLPYGLHVRIYNHWTDSFEDEILSIDNISEILHNFPIEDIKPYLRSMSSMTDEEKREYNKLLYDCEEQDPVDYNITILKDAMLFFVIDWLNEHHFDYRDLIYKGLALKAPEEMYK